jgi:hypothetical protein
MSEKSRLEHACLNSGLFADAHDESAIKIYRVDQVRKAPDGIEWRYLGAPVYEGSEDTTTRFAEAMYENIKTHRYRPYISSSREDGAFVFPRCSCGWGAGVGMPERDAEVSHIMHARSAALDQEISRAFAAKCKGLAYTPGVSSFGL